MGAEWLTHLEAEHQRHSMMHQHAMWTIFPHRYRAEKQFNFVHSHPCIQSLSFHVRAVTRFDTSSFRHVKREASRDSSINGKRQPWTHSFNLGTFGLSIECAIRRDRKFWSLSAHPQKLEGELAPVTGQRVPNVMVHSVRDQCNYEV